MAVVRSPDFLRALIRETALATLIHQRRLTPSCGGQAPTAERTVGPARMIAESLTSKPGIREPDNICSMRVLHILTHSGPQPSRNPALQRAPNALQNGTSLLGRPPGMPVTSRGARAGFQGATHCDKDFSTLSTERVDRAQWRHTIRIVHRHR